jgi:hypothetical protein
VVEIGNVTVEGVSDGSLQGPPTLMFNKTDQDWQQHAQFLDGDGLLTIEMGGFLVRSGERLALVDTGIGPHADPTRTGTFMKNLHSLGAFDDSLGISFMGGRSSSELLPPVVDRLETWEGDTTIVPGIDVRSAPGHTPGSSVIVISSGSARAMLLGDVVHCPAELLSDDWEAIFDVDVALARRTREILARELEGTDIRAAGAHFPGLQFGRLLAAEGRRQWVFDGNDKSMTSDGR